MKKTREHRKVKQRKLVRLHYAYYKKRKNANINKLLDVKTRTFLDVFYLSQKVYQSIRYIIFKQIIFENLIY